MAQSKNLSEAMQQWVQANRSKLKNPTAKQKAIFKKYDQMKEAGTLSKKPAPQKPAAKTKPAPQKPAAKKPKKAPRGYTPGKLYGEDVKPKKTPRGYTPGKVYGAEYVKSQPKLKSQPKKSKPNQRGRKKTDSRVAGLAKNLREMMADQRKRRSSQRGAFRRTYK